MSEYFQARRISSLVFIAALAVLFALQWGPGSRGCDTNVGALKDEVAASVNGRDIPVRDFRLEYREQLASLQRQGTAITEDMARQFGFPTQVLERMVNTELLAQAAEKQGIVASDEELLAFLKKQEAFQKDGQFDAQRYKDIVRDYYRKTEVEFEQMLRRQLAADKMRGVVEASVQVSEDEVKTRYFKEYNKAQATFVRFLPTMFTEKVAALKEPEVLSFEKGARARIEEFFKANTFRYHQAERVRARHILLKVDASAASDKKEEVKKKLEALRAQVLSGKDFAEAAREFSEDTGSKASGGDLGFNERSAWVTAFSDAAFALKVGEVSAPVETQFGFHLIKVEEKQAPVTKKLEEVSREIAREMLTRDRAKELALAEANKALATLKGGKKGLKELFPPSENTQTNAMRFVVSQKPEAVETQEINAGTDSLPQLGPAPELLKGIFSVDAPRTLEKAYEVGEGYVVAVVTQRSIPSEEAYKTQKETLLKEALGAKQAEIQDAFLKGLKKSGQVVLNESSLATSTGTGG